jgi:2-desacetyl-2-hydroxyethyl bacteriochlorophyllide A dehydrogenase
MEMQSVVLKQPFKIELETRQIPKPKQGEVLLQTQYGGICGSDISAYHGTHFLKMYPLVQGHEFSARVAEVAPDNSYGLKAGMLVTGLPYYGCGVCRSCRRGYVQCCPQNKTIGALQDGAFTQYFTLPEWRVYDCSGLDAQQAALIEPFVIGNHAAKRPGIQKGDRVLVIGAGTIGLITAIMAKSLGGEVWIADVAESKLEIAGREFGIHHTILNDVPETFIEKIQEITNGEGFDVVMEAVGIPETFQNSLDAAAVGGKVVSIGTGKASYEFDFNIIQKKHLDIYGSRNGVQQDFLDTINLMRSGKLGDVKKLISAIYPYQEAEKAFRDIDGMGGNVLKAMLQFAG